MPSCEGHVIVVPNKHFENIYDLPDKYGHKIFEISKKMALLLKTTYRCDGVTIRQNNEPASSQHAFHFHLHIYPRYKNDNFDINITKEKFLSDPKNRIKLVRKLKKYLPQVI